MLFFFFLSFFSFWQSCFLTLVRPIKASTISHAVAEISAVLVRVVALAEIYLSAVLVVQWILLLLLLWELTEALTEVHLASTSTQIHGLLLLLLWELTVTLAEVYLSTVLVVQWMLLLLLLWELIVVLAEVHLASTSTQVH